VSLADLAAFRADAYSALAEAEAYRCRKGEACAHVAEHFAYRAEEYTAVVAFAVDHAA
jgi:hypothetical protein